MVEGPGSGRRHGGAFVPGHAIESGVRRSVGAAVAARRAGPTAPTAPPPRRAPSPADVRRGVSPLPTLGGDFLSAAVALLCRDEPLSRAEIGDHADVVAEVADALAAVADRLAHDLAPDLAPENLADPADPEGPDSPSSAVSELVRARDALQAGSAQARRGAAVLWARHIEALRTQVEQARLRA